MFLWFVGRFKKYIYVILIVCPLPNEISTVSTVSNFIFGPTSFYKTTDKELQKRLSKVFQFPWVNKLQLPLTE